MYTMTSAFVRFFNKGIGKDFLLFITVGFFSSLVNYGAFYLLIMYSNSPYLAASAVGYLTGIFISYFGNIFFTFNQTSKISKKHFSKFLFIYLLSLGFGLILLEILVNRFGVQVLLANLYVICFSTITNFSLVRRFIF